MWNGLKEEKTHECSNMLKFSSLDSILFDLRIFFQTGRKNDHLLS